MFYHHFIPAPREKDDKVTLSGSCDKLMINALWVFLACCCFFRVKCRKN